MPPKATTAFCSACKQCAVFLLLVSSTACGGECAADGVEDPDKYCARLVKLLLLRCDEGGTGTLMGSTFGTGLATELVTAGTVARERGNWG
jgi:hypothetical protein